MMSSRSDVWDFLEEIDAPKMVDFALETVSMNEERDDPWFHTVHPFHQLSFHELVAHSPLFVKVAKSGSGADYVSPRIMNSVTKSRGSGKQMGQLNKLELGQHWLKSKRKNIPLKSETSLQADNGKCSGGKVASYKSTSNVGLHLRTCLNGLGKITPTEDLLASSTSNNDIHISTDAKSSSGEGVPLTTSTACNLKSMMPQSTGSFGLLAILKLSNLRKCCRTGLASRVEVKDERQLRCLESASKKFTDGSTRVKNEIKTCSQNSIMSSPDHSGKSSSSGPSTMDPANIKKGWQVCQVRNQNKEFSAHLLRRPSGVTKVGKGQPENDHSTFVKSTIGYPMLNTTRISGIASTNSQGEQTKKSGERLNMKSQLESDIVSSITYNRKVSGIVSSSKGEERVKRLETLKVKNWGQRTIPETRPAKLGTVQSEDSRGPEAVIPMQNKTDCPKPLGLLNNMQTVQCQKDRIGGKENYNIASTKFQKMHIKPDGPKASVRRPLGLLNDAQTVQCHKDMINGKIIMQQPFNSRKLLEGGKITTM